MICHKVVNTFQYLYYNYYFIDEVVKPSAASVHGPTSDSDTCKSEPNKNSYNDDYARKVLLLIMITLLLIWNV